MRTALRVATATFLVLSTGPPALAAPSGPPSSSYATSASGVAAYAALLEEFGFEVDRLRGSLERVPLEEDWTLVLLDPPSLASYDVTLLREFLDRGGRLVTGGSVGAAWTDDVVDDPPVWSAGGNTSYTTGLDGVSTVESAGEGRWSDPGGGTVVAGDTGDALAVTSGGVTFLADASPLQNRLLDRADNAAFGLALAGDAPGPVVFVEGVHGFGPPRGLGAIPARWRWTAAGLVSATLLWMWARGRRLGPPERAVRELPPPRRAYVEALAATLARARRREGGHR